MPNLHAEGGITSSSVYSGTSISITGAGGSVDISGDTGVNITGNTLITGDNHITGDLQVDGNVNVTGKLNAINRTEINIQDNTIRLNTGYTGSGYIPTSPFDSNFTYESRSPICNPATLIVEGKDKVGVEPSPEDTLTSIWFAVPDTLAT